jgi:hypothetical protein
MKELYYILAKEVQKAYQNRIDLGTTEFALVDKVYKDKEIQILLSPGTDELFDWIENVNLLSWNGIKYSARKAARAIYSSEQFNDLRDIKKPLYGAGHSKGGSEIIAFNELFGLAWCVAFAPAPCLRRWKKNVKTNYTIFTDPDDIVHQLGIINFCLPKATFEYHGANDHEGKHIKDHFMYNWVEYTKNLGAKDESK